jgi:hypothetical protein
MSSARANAAARQRRAEPTSQSVSAPQQRFVGQSSRMPPPPQQQQQQQGAPQQQERTKLSISDAIALITLRLGRVESILQNQNKDSQSTSAEFDEGLLTNIISRLNFLENSHKTIENNERQFTANIQQLQTTVNTRQVLGDAPTIQTSSVVDTTNYSQDIENLKEDISNIKDLLIKVQNYTMDTNQKLVDIIFSEEQNAAFPSNDTMGSGIFLNINDYASRLDLDLENVDSIERVREVEFVSENIENIPNLKDIIEKELANSESV